MFRFCYTVIYVDKRNKKSEAYSLPKIAVFLTGMRLPGTTFACSSLPPHLRPLRGGGDDGGGREAVGEADGDGVRREGDEAHPHQRPRLPGLRLVAQEPAQDLLERVPAAKDEGVMLVNQDTFLCREQPNMGRQRQRCARVCVCVRLVFVCT